ADKRIRDLENTQKNLESLIEKQREDILKLEHEAANREQYEMELANLEVEDYEKENQEKKEETGSGKYNEPTDYNASQESVGTLGQRLAELHGVEVIERNDEDKEVELKRSLRNRGKEDQKVEDLAKIRAVERDNYGKDSELNC
uniref:Uncharacterized protein n=1 Tax=Aegilops tauschii subsp. strangulata TaxID=200361 RepID=A0A452YGU4_AEGTS